MYQNIKNTNRIIIYTYENFWRLFITLVLRKTDWENHDFVWRLCIAIKNSDVITIYFNIQYYIKKPEMKQNFGEKEKL